MLMILDGFGINERTEGNAVKLANIPNINNLYNGKYPHTICHTSGRDVGLPDGQMGNSEVGHTNIGAGRIVEAIEKNDGNLVAVADHGNIEQLIDYETGQPHTAHTTNPVPLALVTSKPYGINEGRLADLAPTLLDLMDIEKPVEMTGNSLLQK